MFVVGVDYSMNSPAVTVTDGRSLSTFFATDKRRLHGERWSAKTRDGGDLMVEAHHFDRGAWSPTRRYHELARVVVRRLEVLPPDSRVVIEGYAMGARGRNFDIGECTGAFKQTLLLATGLEATPVPPTEVKKFATGRGTARKEQMCSALTDRIGVDVAALMDMPPEGSPVSDVVDSIWVALYGLMEANR